jgi:hypothetical protein
MDTKNNVRPLPNLYSIVMLRDGVVKMSVRIEDVEINSLYERTTVLRCLPILKPHDLERLEKADRAKILE